MPKVFEKTCTLKVIEYGAEETPAEIMDEIKSVISDCVSKMIH